MLLICYILMFILPCILNVEAQTRTLQCSPDGVASAVLNITGADSIGWRIRENESTTDLIVATNLYNTVEYGSSYDVTQYTMSTSDYSLTFLQFDPDTDCKRHFECFTTGGDHVSVSTDSLCPGFITELLVNEVSASQAVVRWISGSHGNELQMFIVQYKEKNDSNFVSSENIADEGAGNEMSYRLSGLRENTTYVVKVTSVSEDQGSGKNASSMEIIIQTLAIPTINVQQASLVSTINFSWDEIAGNFTRVAIEICSKAKIVECSSENQNISQKTATIIQEDPHDHYFTLLLYQHSELVLRSNFELESDEKPEEISSNTALNGIIIVLSLAVFTLGVACIVVCLLWVRKNIKTVHQKPENQTIQSAVTQDPNVITIERSGSTKQKYQLED